MQNTMIPLTVANTLDQSQKQRVEVPQNATLKQAVQDMKLAPKGQFDIYDAMGSVISSNNAAAHRDSTIYVGVAKVAGGAGIEFDDDWDEGIDLDEIPNKQAHLTLILQDGSRHNIDPQPRETIMQLVERAGFKPRDGSPLEVRDNHQEVVSNLMANDMIGRSFFVVPQRIPGGARKKGSRLPDHPALVPQEIIDQTTAFTQPRGRLEMGGLLIGHIDNLGNNVVVCGFFPKQTEASPGYCEFDGGALSMAMGACDMANSRCGGPHTPNIQIIGWIHTHPDIGIFLSGIDIDTFANLRANRKDGRIVAVVVDPLRKEHGVFISEKAARNVDAQRADSTVKLSEDLEARYNKFLTRMRYFQTQKGKKELPFIMPGVLYSQRQALGDEDDIVEARFQTLDLLSRNYDGLLTKTVPKIQNNFTSIQADLSSIRANLSKGRDVQKETNKTIQFELKEQSTARAALQLGLTKKIDQSNEVLRSELKKESGERLILEQHIIQLLQAVNELRESNNRLIENQRSMEEKLSRPVKFALKVHPKTPEINGSKIITVIESPPNQAMVDA